jgi:hypothetical protein
MKKFLFSSIAICAMLGGPALAADMPVKASVRTAAAPYDWSGIYFGMNAGGVWHEVDRTFPNPTSGGFIAGLPFSTDDANAVWGFHAGAQFQFGGGFILGVEAAGNVCVDRCKSTSGVLPATVGGAPGFTANTLGQHTLSELLTVGGRGGYGWDNLMVFVSGGVASARLDGTYCSSITLGCGAVVTVQSGHARTNGWYLGGGLEYVVMRGTGADVLLGAEYQHIELERGGAFCFNVTCTPPTGADYDLAATSDIVRARLTVKINPLGALARP